MPVNARGGHQAISVLGLDCDEPGALDRLLRNRMSLLQKADIICGTEPVLKILANDEGLAGKLLPLSPPLAPIFECLADLRAKGMVVVVLADGDPLFFGIGASLARRLGTDAIHIEPAISSLQAVASRISLPWHDMECVSLHGRGDVWPLYHAVLRNRPICVLTDGKNSPDIVARLLIDRGVDWMEVHVFEKMGLESEKSRTFSLEECAAAHFDAPATMMLIPAANARRPHPGLDETGIMGAYCTKRPIRGAALEMLSITSGDTVWDIGAGSGIMAMEMSSLAWAGRVVAVEEKPGRALDIQANRAKYGAVNVEILRGHAPGCLDGLPSPDCVFIGGGLSGLDGERILNKCADSLLPGGRLVTACVLLESFCLAREVLGAYGWNMDILGLVAACAVPLGNGSAMSPIRPVRLIGIRKPEKETHE